MHLSKLLLHLSMIFIHLIPVDTPNLSVVLFYSLHPCFEMLWPLCSSCFNECSFVGCNACLVSFVISNQFLFSHHIIYSCSLPLINNFFLVINFEFCISILVCNEVNVSHFKVPCFIELLLNFFIFLHVCFNILLPDFSLFGSSVVEF